MKKNAASVIFCSIFEAVNHFLVSHHRIFDEAASSPCLIMLTVGAVQKPQKFKLGSDVADILL